MSWASRARAILRWMGRHELGVVLSIVVVALGTWGFAELASEMSEGATRDADRTLLLALRDPDDVAAPIGPEWLKEMGRDLSALGGMAVLTLLTVVVLGYLLLIRKPRAALFVLSSVIGAALVSTALKGLFQRPRPDLVPHASYAFSTSFPSGHAMLSAAVYLTLGALVARVQASLLVKAYVLLCACVLALLVGFSRVYVGVHWPTDVLAGWAAGAVWAASCWLGARALQRRARVEGESRAPD